MNLELKKATGARMRELRKALGFTQEKMSSYFDIGRANYSRIEKGEVWPGIPILLTLRKSFNVSLEWLITNTGYMFILGNKESDDKIEMGRHTPEVKELLQWMERAPMVRHGILSFFKEYKVEQEKIIQQQVEESLAALASQKSPEDTNAKKIADGEAVEVRKQTNF